MDSSTSAVPPGSSIIAAATSHDAMIEYCGEVEVCIRYASLNTSRSSLRSSESCTRICEACERPASSLCVDCVENTIDSLQRGRSRADGVVVAVEVVEGRVRQPGFVEVQRVDLPVEHLLDLLDVVEDAVVGRLRDRQHARLGVLVGDERIGGDLPLDAFHENSLFGIGPMMPKLLRVGIRKTGIAPVMMIECSTDLWQLRSTTTMSPGATVECQTILFDVDVPLVTKYR